MKPPKFLKSVISLTFYVLFLKLIATGFTFIIFLFGSSSRLSSLDYINIVASDRSREAATALFSLEMVYTVIIFYAVYIIRKIIKDLEKDRLYTNLQISGLSLSGKLIIGVVFLQVIAEFITIIVFDNKLEVSVSFENDLGNPFLVITIGLFLIYLGKIFENSARLKTENELTV